MQPLYDSPPYWRWPTLGDYRAIETYVPPPLVDLTDPPRLIAHAVRYGFQLDEGIDPDRVAELEPKLADRIVAEAANRVQGGRLEEALDPALTPADRDPQQQAIWEAVVVDGRPLYLPANPLLNFFDTASFLPVIRLRHNATRDTWYFLVGQDPDEIGLPDLNWEYTRVVSPSFHGGLRSARAWIAERTRAEFKQRSQEIEQAAMEKAALTWAQPGLGDQIAAVPAFPGYNWEKTPQEVAGGLQGAKDEVRFALRVFGGRIYLAVFDLPQGRRQYLAAVRQPPLADDAGPRLASGDSGVSGGFFQFPFHAVDEWWARLGVWAMAEFLTAM